MRDDIKLYVYLVGYALLASFGGLMGYLMRTIDKGHQISYGRAFLEAGSAGFVGALVALSCTALDLNPLWTGVVVGVCGWLGATASIRVLESLIFKRLGLTRGEVKEAANVRSTTREG